MKYFTHYLVTFLAAFLPLTIWAQKSGTELKVLTSTFTGTVYGVGAEIYSDGRLTTAEGNDWIWTGEGESKSPVIQMTEVGGESCLSVKLKTAQLVMNTDFSVPGTIKKLSFRYGGNIGRIDLDYGDMVFRYNVNITSDRLEGHIFTYDDLEVKLTNPGQLLNIIMYPKDESSGEPIYLKSISIETEVSSMGENSIASLFEGFDWNTNSLFANDGEHNWNLTLPNDGTQLTEMSNVEWCDEPCLYMRLMGGSSSYPKLTLTSDFPVEGKVKKIIVKAGGDILFVSYPKDNGENVESHIAGSTVPYYDEFVMDFGDGINVNGNLSFYLYAGRNTYLHSVTIVMEGGSGGSTETDGIVSSFVGWELWDTTESFKVGVMTTNEDNPWIAFIYNPDAPVGKTSLQVGDSSAEDCIAIGNYSDAKQIEIELQNQFAFTGHIKKIVVSFAGQLNRLNVTVCERNTGENMQEAHMATKEGEGFTDAELFFDGITEYADADIRIWLSGCEPIFLKSITIFSEADDPEPGEELLSGKCGDNLEFSLTELPYNVWIWDYNTYQSVEAPAYKLTITGTGDMYDYDDWENIAPWRKEYTENIAEIEMPEGMTHIGDEAFDACTNARILNLPSTLRSIGTYAFYNVCMWPSEDLHLPDNLTSIGYRAFAYCYGIKNLYLPASLIYISDAALIGMPDIQNFYVDEDNPAFKVDGNSLIQIATNKLIAATKYTVIPDYVECIGSAAFQDIRIEEVVIPSKVASIESYAFAYTYLSDVVIPNSVKTIGSYAFYNCSKLLSVTIGSGVTKIDATPFINSKNILDIYCFADPETLIWDTRDSNSENRSFKPDKMTQMHVKVDDVEKWQEKFGFLNVTFVGDLASVIVPIIDITEVAASTLQNEDLSDNIVDNIYYNLDESTSSGYTNGYLLIGQTTDMSQVGDGEPGSDEVRNNFTGIIFEVAPGRGTITIDVETLGKTRLAVRIGNGTPTYASYNERREVYVSYDVTKPTYVYIYAVSTGGSPMNLRAPSVGEDALLIYNIRVIPDDWDDAIDNVTVDNETTFQWYDLSGKPVAMPRQSGIYIRNGKKVVVK